MNYWKFGDYIGIGCKAHGKITKKNKEILKTEKNKNIIKYIKKKYIQKKYFLSKNDKILEFFLNTTCLLEPIYRKNFEIKTFLQKKYIKNEIKLAKKKGYLKNKKKWIITSKGRKYLNEFLSIFIK